MATRLDRLFLLLDTGSTPVVRKSAAFQLGEVQKLHPHELHNLLTRVYGYLSSASWDTRIAAGHAVSALARNVPQWTPEGTSEVTQCKNEFSAASTAPADMLRFQNFNVHTVLQQGASLLGSEGNEYDVNEEECGLNEQERLTRQKRLLNRRLGLDGAGGLGIAADALFKEEDLVVTVDTKPPSCANNTIDESVRQQLLVKLAGGSTDVDMSAREKNRAKRKARQLAKQSSKDSTADPTKNCEGTNGEDGPTSKCRRTASVAGDAGDDGGLADAAADTTLDVDEMSDWPFEAFSKLLMNGLFSSSWEKRHGAATGLREVVKVHGKGAGKMADMTPEQMESANQMWLEDLAIRLICVLALDRFGDFVSDEVVAPVREMCAQCIGVVLRHMRASAVLSAWRPLYQLLTQRQWEVRHGGLLAVKYLLAVRQDLAERLLPLVLTAVVSGLRDDDDDVRAVAAAALLPVTTTLVTTLPEQVGHIVECLWHTLLDLDDLTASTNSIMMLLSALLAQPHIDSETRFLQSLSQLVPRLWPFMMHNIASVRAAALETLHTLLARCLSQEDVCEWLTPILPDLLRHVYQRTLLEAKPDILSIVGKVWQAALAVSLHASLTAVTSQWLGVWLCLAMQPAQLPFQQGFLLVVKHEPKELTPSRVRHASLTDMSEPAVQQLFLGGSSCLSDSATQQDVTVVRARITAARLLGSLFRRLVLSESAAEAEAAAAAAAEATAAAGGDDGATPDGAGQPIDAVAAILLFHLASKSAVQRYTVGLLLMESPGTPQQRWPAVLTARLHECLCETVYFDEIALPFTRLQADCLDFAASLRDAVPAAGDIVPPGVLTLEQAHALCTTSYNQLCPSLTPAQHSTLDTRRRHLLACVTQTASEQQTLHGRVQACLAGVLVRMRSLPEKLNPVVRPLMDALRNEANQQLQLCAAESLSHLVALCRERDPSPNPKIIRNLAAMLCSDREQTPRVAEERTGEDDAAVTSTDGAASGEVTCSRLWGIITVDGQQKTVDVHRGRKPTLAKRSASVDIALDSIMTEEDEDRKAVLVQRRGAELALTTVARDGGATLPELVPSVWQAMVGPLQKYVDSDADEVTDASVVQALVNSLQLFEVVGPALHTDLHKQLVSLAPQLARCLSHPLTAARHMGARALAMLARLRCGDTMNHVLDAVVPTLGATHDVGRRQGAIEAVAHIVQQLGVDVVPYIVLLVVPVLGCMNDHDPAVRLMAVSCFATLVRLMPLEAGIPDPPSLKSSLIKQKEIDRRFLEQLLDGSKVENYVIPVPIHAKLRKYQQDGVNWIAFLNKYRLHGVLCDDMGLGKTLQSICMLAADHHYREQRRRAGGQTACERLPSLVVCPPTLTGHWIYEVEKFVDRAHLHPLHYTGVPRERLRLQKEVPAHNLIIASYDMVRNDIEFFSSINWNYCILDEGHIIKNSKTKLFRAIKQLRCGHRLILTGTPIQNSVLELWALFDFLLPGLLGSERQFLARYGRPILQSRDAKSSSREQEAGALAMEALHRQVLPFLLRRLKEDVLQDLPPKIIQDYYCDLSTLQMKLYEDFAKTRAKKGVEEGLQQGAEDAKTSTAKKAAANAKDPACSHIFQALQYLRKVCNHPALVVKAGHPDHDRLVAQLRAQGSQLRDLQHAPKLGALKQLLLDCGIGVSTDGSQVVPVVNQHRALVFCQLKGMLDIVEHDLLRAEMPNVSYLRLDGSVPAGNRHVIVNRFNNDPSIDVLLLTTHVGGLGLNLTGADTVIFVEHDWNPMKDMQAMDRAHRIGQKKVVNVFRLITRGTLEEKIMGLQKFKMNIANSVISRENSSLASMGTDQVLDLFSVGRGGGGAATPGPRPAPSGTQNVLEGLGELWDEKQYESEHNMESFLLALAE